MVRHPKSDGSGVRVRNPDFYDFMTQHPELGSTKLILTVYEALEAKGIPFIYSYEFGDALVTGGLKEHIRTHFYIPSINLAIIVQGGYWFDSAARLQDTALTIALLEYDGVKVLWWTEPEIIARGVDAMIGESPELMTVVGAGRPMSAGGDIIRYREYFTIPPHPIRAERRAVTRRRRRPRE